MPKVSQTKRDALFKMVRSRALWAVDSAPAIKALRGTRQRPIGIGGH